MPKVGSDVLSPSLGLPARPAPPKAFLLGSSPPEAQKTEAGTSLVWTVSIKFSGAYNTTFNPFIFFTKKAID